MKQGITLILPLLLAPMALGASSATDIRLASNGATDYQIVCALDASGIDRYAAETLAGYLRESTGAEFAIVTADERAAKKPAIFVGLSKPARVLLGPNPLGGLNDQEHVARSHLGNPGFVRMEAA
jgi:hypothetical protein